MSNWLKRFQERQRELAQGADADLVQANRQRYKRALLLLAFDAGLIFLNDKVNLSPLLRTAVGILSVIIFLLGLLLLKWAWKESVFLNRPDPEVPPSILKK
jgi:hypothetical protein